MELKFYLRGLGLGIIITAVIMGVALSKRQTMTDEQVRERARELGMIENTVLAGEPEEDDKTDADEEESVEILESTQEAAAEEDIERIEQIRADADAAGLGNQAAETEDHASETDDNAAETGVDAIDIGTDTENTDDSEEDTKPTEDAGDSDALTEKAAEPAVETAVSRGSVTITIRSGEGSDTASRKLAAAGAVLSATGFDDFLCANGYDKRIRPGTYTIPSDSSDEQIARIITGQE